MVSGQANPHNDGLEIYSGNNTKIWGNNIRMTNADGSWLDETGAINLTSEFSSIDSVQINGNWLGGGSYTVYVRKSGSGNAYSYSNVSVTNNRWYGSPPAGTAQYGPESDDGGSLIFTNDVWDDTGQPI